METITLYFKDERSDKVYQAWLDRNNQLYDVKFAYGRRGGTLQTGTKNSTPLSLAQATALMTSLVREKQGKGYTQGESGAAYTATVNQDRFTGILPMLLNPIEEEALSMYLNDPLWIAEEKYDGVRMLLRINVDGSVDAINRKGLLVGAPQCILDEARGIAPGKFPLIIDGECVGEKFYAFDYICEAPLRERKHRLRSLKLNRFDHIEEVLYQDINKLKFFDQLRDNNAEGIVLKMIEGMYRPGRPAKYGHALKFKFKASATCLVGEVNEKRSVRLRLLDETNRPIFVGSVAIPPNHEIPSVGEAVEVEYLYAYKGGALFQPVYKGPRQDVEVDSLAGLKYKAGQEEDEG